MPASTLRTVLRGIGRRVPDPMRARVRPLARAVGLAAPAGNWWQALRSPWERALLPVSPTACNICGWQGSAFVGVAHSESAKCPQCGAVARDRFLLWSFTSCVPDGGRRLRVLETSPRLGLEYRQYMRLWFDYRTSDFDQCSHTGDLVLDLQDIDLPDESVDVLLSPHVLEHVPDTDAALREIRRVLAPGGAFLLQVPLQCGRTHVPREPTFHADNTPVMFNFGWDLTDRLRAAGFMVSAMVPDLFARQLNGRADPPQPDHDDFDVASIFAEAHPDVEVVADAVTSERLGLRPAHQFVTWLCVVPEA